MFKYTKFYTPVFETPCPNGQVWTYDLEGNLAKTYKDTDGTLNTNPIILDDNGSAIIYQDDAIEYRYIIKDFEGNTIADTKVPVLKGKDAPPSTEKGEKGKKGRKGFQGVSGDRGADGLKGITGDKGLPFLTKKVLTNNEIFEVPAGIKEIFVTAVAGGGSAANWSNYVYIYDVKSPRDDVSSVNNLAFKTDDNPVTRYSKNTYTYHSKEFAFLALTPGSGFAGESRYRYKISFDDTTKPHKVQVFIGSGGQYSSSKASGNDGTNTKIYVDGALKLDLKGGLGGEQQVPISGNNVPADPGSIQINKGAKSGYFYGRISNSNFFASNQFQNDPVGESGLIIKTKYNRKLNNVFEQVNVNIGYAAKVQTVQFTNSGQDAAKTFPMSDVKNLKGEDSIFGSVYSSYQSMANGYADRNDLMQNSKKTVGPDDRGYGSGGDCSFTRNNQGSLNGSTVMDYYGYFSRLYYLPNTGYFGVCDKNYIKNQVIDALANFEAIDSYDKGVTDIPSKDDAAIWKAVDDVYTKMSNNTNLFMYDVPGFYTSTKVVNVPIAQQQAISHGDNGMNGYCYIEFGSLTEL